MQAILDGMLKERLTRNLSEAAIHLDNKLREVGLLRGNDDYQKFVIVCSIRTGSTMLCSLLNSHPDVQAYFELFHRHLQSVAFGLPGYKWLSRDDYVVALHNDDPVSFLNKYVYNRKRRNVKAVGFKLLYTQARKHNPWWNGPDFERWWSVVGRAPLLSEARSDLWEHLSKDLSYHIIHLKRRNYLKRIVSGQTAIATGNWGVGATGGIGDKRSVALRLDGEHLLQDFEAFRRMEQEADMLFANHPKLEIFYEDMIHEQERTGREIQQFLGLAVRKLHAKTEKQSTKKLSEIIENFTELQAQFHGSQWESFFDDDTL